MGGVLSIEPVVGDLGIIGPFNSKEDISMVQNGLARYKVQSISKRTVILRGGLDLVQSGVGLLVGFEGTDLIVLINQ
jgi:hypothetical protein